MRGCWFAATVSLLLCNWATVVSPLAVMSVDLGSEFLKIAIVKPGVPMEIALNKEGRRKTANIVAFKDGERSFGDAALAASMKRPPTAFRFLNDLLAKTLDHPLVDNYRRTYPHIALGEKKGRGTVTLKKSDNEDFSPEELLAMILNKAQDTASNFAEQPIAGAVVTVPAYFSQAERRAVAAACDLAGIKLLQLMTDDAAVALNYGVFRRKEFNATAQNFLIFDMGARSTVASIASYQLVQTKENGFAETNPQVTIKSVGFDRTLGGLEFTLRLRNHLAKVAFNEKKLVKQDVTANSKAMSKLLKEAERVKLILSANKEAYAQIEGLLEEKDFRQKVTRDEFLGMCQDLLARVAKPVEEAMKSSEMTWGEINQVLLFGGGTRIPKVRENVLEVAKGHDQLGMSLNTDESAAMGAVYQAAHLSKGFRVKKFLVKDSNVYPIEVEFERALAAPSESAPDSTEAPGKIVKRVLFTRNNPYPQRKVLTFPKHRKDFGVRVNYGDVSFLDGEHQAMFGGRELKTVALAGVDKALDKHSGEDVEAKGVKAHFRMDESGILQLEKVESLFEKTIKEEEAASEASPSTLDQIKDAFSNMFGEKKEEEEQQGKDDEKKENEKETTKEETGQAQTKSGQENQKGEKTKEENPEIKKEEENKEEAKDQKKEEKVKEGANKTEKDEKKDKAKEEKPKKVVPKLVTIKEPISSELHYEDTREMTVDELKLARETLKRMDDADAERVAREAAQNALEGFIYDAKDKMNLDETASCATEEERETFLASLNKADDWLFDQGPEVPTKTYKDKLSELKKEFAEFFGRLNEKENRPKAIESLVSHLNTSHNFYVMSKNLSDSTPDDPIFTEVELDTLAKLNVETQTWMDVVVEKQKTKKDFEKPAFTVSEVEAKLAALDREIKYLINKAKFHKPKPKKEPAKEEEAKKNEEKVIPPTESPVSEEGTGKDEATEAPAADRQSPEAPEAPSPDSPSSGEPTSEPPPAEQPPTEPSSTGEPSGDEAKKTHDPDDEL